MTAAADKTNVKRLIHRANYRGFREMDLILGGFAKEYAHTFSAEELIQFETVMDEKDHDIYDWICGVKPVPTQHDTPLFARLAVYKPSIIK